jgi:hypothetical protein
MKKNRESTGRKNMLKATIYLSFLISILRLQKIYIINISRAQTTL